VRAIWKGTISFGLVNIPISLGIATKRSDPSFRTLDAKSMQPIQQQLYSPDRDETVSRDETIKGYEISKGRFVPITDEELESVAVERRRTIDILAFVDMDEIDPVYYDRTYYIEPQEAATKPYALLVEAMRESGKVAIGKFVLTGKEHLVVLRPSGDSLVMEILFYPEDVRSKDEIDDKVRGAKVTAAERKMAEQLIESLTQPFEPSQYENEHKRDLLALIEAKAAGEEIPPAPEPAAPAAVPDLMSALKASLEQAKKDGEPAKKQPASKKAAASNGKPKAAKKTAAKKRATTKK
jgi:DNA end-binding protein Ku